MENTRVLCRHCNQSLGGRQGKGKPRFKKPPAPVPLKTSRAW